MDCVRLCSVNKNKFGLPARLQYPSSSKPIHTKQGHRKQVFLNLFFIHYFCFPSFSNGLHDGYLYLQYISLASIESPGEGGGVLRYISDGDVRSPFLCLKFAI